MIADQQQRPQDDAERLRALDPRRSFIVQAPAGSGKTELLVRRFLKLLALVERPEEILAVTFTKKAAAEMRRRVLKELSDSGQAGADVAHRLRIQTIDALCASLTRQMPVLARFGGQPAIVEDASEFYREAAARVLGEPSPAAEKLLRHLDNDVGRATMLVADMLRSRDRWLRRTGTVPGRAELEAALVSERDRLLGFARSIHPAASEELARELLTREYTWRKKHDLAQSLSGNEPLRQALEALCRMPPAKYDEQQWEALEAILALLKPAVAHLKVLFGEQGKADFTELAHGALRALGAADDPSDLLLSIDRKISHVLVDEFQDTSVSQFDLIARLTSGWQPGDGRTLFVVGDPMQSIYRFREAEVSLFLQARKEGIGAIRLEPLTLTTNFRSQANLVEWFNISFSRILPPKEDEASGAVPYSSATRHDAALPGPAVSWHCFYDREAEARQVVKILQEAKGKAAILVRNRAHLDEIVPALKAAGIRWRAIQIEQLNERQVVQDLYALTRVLTHLGDRIAWLAVLRAPWCGLSLSDLLLLTSGPPDTPLKGGKAASEARGGLQLGLFSSSPAPASGTARDTDLIPDLMRDVSHLSADGRARIARVRAALEPAWQNRLRGTLRERVEAAWLALGGPACVADATGLEDAEIFLDELERLEDAGEVDLEALEYQIGKLYALPDVEAPDGAVEIMTIHRAKGLEFDTVIVPGLDRLPRAGPKPLFAWKSLPGARLLLAPINETGTLQEPTYNYVRELDRQADDIESGRLFYVAATRAESRLHLLACAKPDKEAPVAKEPARRTLLSKIWWQAKEHFGPAPAAADDDARSRIPDLLRRLPADYAIPAAPAAIAWQSPQEGRTDAGIEFSWVGETARHVGTVVHRWLQRIAEDELRGWDANRIGGLRNRFAAELARRGVSADELQASTERVVTALANAVTDERGRWVLGPHPEARTEYRMRAYSDNRFRTYVMDRVFRDEGALWIVDHKTSGHEGSDVEAFLDRERERYAAQLEAYSGILQGSRLGLYFPLLKGWRQWNR